MLCPLLLLLNLPSLVCTVSVEYIVFPKDRKDRGACSATNRTLSSKGLERVESYDSALRGVTEFWLVRAERNQFSTIRNVNGVRDAFENGKCAQNCGSPSAKVNDEALNHDPTVTVVAASRTKPPSTPTPIPRMTVMQRDASQDLSLVSWPAAMSLPRRLKGFVYDVLYGSETYIYVIGDGLNLGHRDFVESRSEGWYFGPNTPRYFRDDSSPSGFTSCAASKAGGWYNGVSKNSKIISIKSTMSLADNLWAFARVLEEVVSKGRQRKSVILYPRSSYPIYRPDARLTSGWDQIHAIMQDLFAEDVVIVTCAGDDVRRAKGPPDLFPASWASAAFPVIVAGAVTNSGDYARFSKGTDISGNVAWAPGNGVVCVSNISSLDQKGQGTAFAAGMVAGLAAYLLNSWQRPGHVAADMRVTLSKRSSRLIFPRSRPKVIWNFENGFVDPNDRSTRAT